MKFIPDGLGRRLGEQGLLASENAPKLLFVGGVVGMVGSTVLACRATLQVSDVLERVKAEKEQHEEVKAEVDSPDYKGTETYPDREYKKDITAITFKGFGKIARLYAPSVLLGGASLFALTKSHNLLQDRNLALTAAYAAIDGAYTRYRERVVDRYGEEVDRELRYDTEHVDEVDEETGEIVATEVVTGAPGAAYKRWFSKDSTSLWSPDPRINNMVLSNAQNWANDKLRIRGHLFLNEVLGELGLSHTTAGQLVGWRWNKNSGDDYVDFGIFEGKSDIPTHNFNGPDGAILLDFNVDGVIYNLIEEEEGI